MLSKPFLNHFCNVSGRIILLKIAQSIALLPPGSSHSASWCISSPGKQYIYFQSETSAQAIPGKQRQFYYNDTDCPVWDLFCNVNTHGLLQLCPTAPSLHHYTIFPWWILSYTVCSTYIKFPRPAVKSLALSSAFESIKLSLTHSNA